MTRTHHLAAVVLALLAILVPQRAAHARPLVKEQVLRAQGKGWTFTFRYPTLDQPGALMGVRGALADYNSQSRAIAEKALADFKRQMAELQQDSAPPRGTTSTVDATYTVCTNSDAGLVSVRWFAYRMFAGGAHPDPQIITSNWPGGLPMWTIADLFTSPRDGLATLSREALAALRAKPGLRDRLSFTGEGLEPKAENFEAFIIRKHGLQLFFQRGQVAAGAVGSMDVIVKWNALRAVLKPEVASLVKRL